ncbi:MAG: hypothetical protein ACJAXS_000641 [Colwellia sp.]|jgi:hypothetical protein
MNDNQAKHYVNYLFLGKEKATHKPLLFLYQYNTANPFANFKCP